MYTPGVQPPAAYSAGHLAYMYPPSLQPPAAYSAMLQVSSRSPRTQLDTWSVCMYPPKSVQPPATYSAGHLDYMYAPGVQPPATYSAGHLEYMYTLGLQPPAASSAGHHTTTFHIPLPNHDESQTIMGRHQQQAILAVLIRYQKE
jgi:hypothetical protein